MGMTSGQPTNGSGSGLLILTLLLGAGALFFYGYDPNAVKGLLGDTSTQEKISANSPQAQKLVNKHLQKTNQKIELDQLKRKIENEYSRPQVGTRLGIEPDHETSNNFGVEMSTDRNSDGVANDLSRGSKPNDYNSPHAIVQGELLQQQQAAEYERAYREEYKRQFIENARRNGWHIEVDDNFVVRRVEKINPNQNPRLFAPSAGGSQ